VTEKMFKEKSAWRVVLAENFVDIAIGVAWALILAAVIIFKSGVSQFIYVDF
jgi:Mg/Co/Ni transporter MgtE